MIAGTDIAYRLAKKHKLKTACGTDILFSAGLGPAAGGTAGQAGSAGTRPPKRSSWRPGRTPNCLALSGKRNPYPGKLGVVEEGALADLLAGRWQPAREHLNLIADPGKNFVVIMKDGKIYKNTVSGENRGDMR